MRDAVKKIMELCRRHKPAKNQSLRDVIRTLVRTIKAEMTDFRIVFLNNNIFSSISNFMVTYVYICLQ